MDRTATLLLSLGCLVLSALFVAAGRAFTRRERRQLEQRLELVELAMKVSSSTIWEYVLRDGSVAKSQAFSPRLMTWATGYDQTPVLDWETNLSRGLTDPEDRSRLTRAIQSCVDGETPDFRVEVRTRQHDGQIRWRLVRGVVSRDPDGAPTSFVGVGTDITELKQAEGDLKHAESEMRRATEQLALATQLSKVYIWSFELLDGQIGKAPATFVNVWESLGYDVPDSRMDFGSAMRMVILSDDQAEVGRAVVACLAGETPGFEAEYRIRHKDGSVHWNLGRGIVTRDADGKPLRFLGTSVDITEVKRVQEEARRNKERLERAVLGSKACTWDFELVDGTILNSRAVFTNLWELLGYDHAHDADHFAGGLASLLHPEDQQNFAASVQTFLDGQSREWERELRTRYKDGTDRWHLARGVVERDATSGRALRFTGSSVDITEHKYLEEKLEQAKDRLELALRSSNLSMFEFDMPDGTLENSSITLFNFWEQLGHVEPPDGFAAASELVLLPEERQQVIGKMQAYLDGTTPSYEIEHRVLHKDGSVQWRLARGVAVRDQHGTPVRFVGTHAEITRAKQVEGELLRAREAAESANRAKDEFLANVSHEIRTPMNAILGMTELALDSATNEHQRQVLATVESAARHLLGIINDLLDFSKIAAGKLVLDHDDFSLLATVGDTVRALAVRAHRKGLELTYHVDGDVPEALDGDAGRLRQVLTNLVGNAIKFTAKGEVALAVTKVTRSPPGAASSDPVTLTFTVRDTGIGISREKQSSIFRAFEQEDSSTTRRYGGTGLGLTISAQLVALMGGEITVDSEPGKGSTFRFTAQFARSSKPQGVGTAGGAPGRPTARGLVNPRSTSLRILAAEDNELNLMLLQELLRQRGHDAEFATDGLTALSLAIRGSYDVMLLDVHMPEMDGFEVARAIREQERTTQRYLPIIALTARSTEQDRERCLSAGMDDFLPKPIAADALWAAVDRVAATFRAAK